MPERRKYGSSTNATTTSVIAAIHAQLRTLTAAAQTCEPQNMSFMTVLLFAIRPGDCVLVRNNVEFFSHDGV